MLILGIAALLALAAGATGTWSPCGLSMVETLAGAGSAARVRRACAAFALGAVAGGIATFATLALVGAALTGSGAPAIAVAVVVALVAAAGELAGVRVLPQIRRQVPEPWRRHLPPPVSAALYGILLGLGFTTFVLSFAVWALAGICIAVGSPQLGLVVGAAFGLGRAVPVVLFAARHEGLGRRALVDMAERPRLLRAARISDGVLLAALGIALAAGLRPDGAAAAAMLVSGDAHDPSASDGHVAWETSLGEIVVRGPLAERRLTGLAGAVGGGNLAVASPDAIEVRPLFADATTAAPTARIALARTPSAIGVSASWVAWRATRPGGGDVITVTRIDGTTAPFPVAGTRFPAGLSGPSLDADRLVYAENGPTRSRIVLVDLSLGTRTVVRTADGGQLRDPSLLGDRLLHVRETPCVQVLAVGRAVDGARDRALLTRGSTTVRDTGRDPGRTRRGSEASGCPAGSPPRGRTVLGTTALDATTAYVTGFRARAGGLAAARLLQVSRQ